MKRNCFNAIISMDCVAKVELSSKLITCDKERKDDTLLCASILQNLQDYKKQLFLILGILKRSELLSLNNKVTMSKPQ